MSRPIPAATGLWRVAGALALAHVILMLGGNSLQPSVLLGDSPHDSAAGLLHGSLPLAMTGGYVEYLGFLVFLVDAVLIARLLRGSGEVQRWLGSCIAASASVVHGRHRRGRVRRHQAAVYDGHHGAGLMTAVTVDDVRNFGYFLSIGVLGVFTLAVAGAVQATRLLPRWPAWTGYLAGAASIAAVAAARVGALDYANIAWLVWFVALAVVALRGPRTTSPAAAGAEFARV